MTCVTESKYISPIATKTSYLAYLPAILIAIGIAVVSLWEFPHLPSSIQASDKLIHGFMYALLGIALMVPVYRFSRTRVIPYIYVCGVVTFYGALMEVLQQYCTVSRTGSLNDLCADFIGALIGVLIIFLITRSRDPQKIINHKS